jgi:hypothetical protein
MKKLLIGLAVAGLFSGAGIVMACDLDKNASTDAAPNVSKAAPTVIACDGGSCPAPNKQVTKKTAAKATAKPPVIACDGAACGSSVPANASVAKPAVVACETGGC